MKKGHLLRIILVLLFFMTISLTMLFLYHGSINIDVFNYQKDNERRIMAEMIDGEMMFSTDRGETWSETPPEELNN